MLDSYLSDNYAKTLKLLSSAQESDCVNVVNYVEKMPKPQKRVWPLVRSSVLYDLIKENKGLKHLYKIRSNVKFIDNDPMLSLNVHFYNKYSPVDLYGYAHDYDLLKSLSVWAQKTGPKFKGFQRLVGIETLYGWRPKDESIDGLVTQWVSDVFHPNYYGSEDKFDDVFRQKIRAVLSWRDGKIPPLETLEEYLINITETGTSGSAFDPGGKRLEMHFEDIPIKPYNNKFSKSAALSVSNKLKRILRYAKQKCKVSVKLEFFPKLRLIVSADYDTTLKMRFVDRWLMQWMKGCKLSTLWLTKEQTWDMWVNFGTRRNSWKVPVDQSGFDHHVSKRMVKIMINEIRYLVNNHCTEPSEYDAVMDRIIYALDGGTIIWNTTSRMSESKSTEYLNGVLSGWQWTAFLDTICNIAEAMMAVDIMNDFGIKTKLSDYFNAQGDDQWAEFQTARESLAYLTAIRFMGFVVHPTKNFISKAHNEYLRKVSYDNTVNGYAARMVNSLLWLYPGTNQPKSKLTRQMAIATNWEKFCERADVGQEEMVSLIRADSAGAKIDAGYTDTFLKTAKTLGGFGLECNTTSEFETIPGRWKRITINGDGYKEFKLRYGFDQSREFDNWLLSVSGTPVEAKHVELRSDDENEIIDRTPLTPLDYDIRSGASIAHFRRSEEPLNTLMTSDIVVAERYFPNIREEVRNFHAPRSWVIDYARGNIKTTTPRFRNLGSEYAGLFWGKFNQSTQLAMLMKSTRDHEKWKRLNLYSELNADLFLHSKFDLPRMVG